METDVEDFLVEDDNQFSLEEMENALSSNDSFQFNSNPQKSVLKELNRSPVKRGKRLAASRPISYRQISLSNSSDNSEANTSSSNSSDNTAKQPALSRKRNTRLKKPLAKKKKYMNKENIPENTLEPNNRPALLDRTNSSERSNKFPKDGKDVVNEDKIVSDSSVPENEVESERPIPVYKRAVANVRLTPPVDNKMDLYEFEIDENEQPVKKRKRQPRIIKNRRKMATKPVKNPLQNIIVPERTINLRCDNSAKSKSAKLKTGKVRFDIVKSIEKHTDALERQKKAVPENTPMNPHRNVHFQSGNRGVVSTADDNNVIKRKLNESNEQKLQSIKTVTNQPECMRQELESISTFDFLICVNTDERKNQPNVAIYKNLKDDSFEGACRGWDENLQPVLVLDDSASKTKELSGKADHRENHPHAAVLKKLKNDSFEGACRGWDENLQPVIVLDDSKDLSDLSTPVPVVPESANLGWDENCANDMDCSTNEPRDSSRFETSDSIVFESAVLGRDNNDTEVDINENFGFAEDSNDFVDINKDRSKSSNSSHSVQQVRSINPIANHSLQQIHSSNKIANDSVQKVHSTNPIANHSVQQVRSRNQIANDSVLQWDQNNSKIDFDKNFGFSVDEDSTDSVDVNKDRSKSSNSSHLVQQVRSRNPIPNHSFQQTHSRNQIANDSVQKVRSTNPIENHSVQQVRSRNQIANDSVLQWDQNNSKVDFDKNFGFSVDEDSNDFIDINKDNSKSSNVSTDQSSTSSRLETEKPKQPGAPFVDVIKRLKGQLNITAVSTPVSTKQTKLNFHFKNKSTVSSDSVADTSLCSPIAQQTSSDNCGLTPTFLKPPRRSYTHTPKANKTVRFGTSFVFDQKELKGDDDDDAEDLFEDTFKDKAASPKKVNHTYKKAGKAVKKEEKEIERLVSAMNSQFQKVEEFQLCVEK